MPDLDQTEMRQIVENIDFWCQWDETFGEDADVLRQFFQERHDLLSSLFTHFLMVEAKCHKPGHDWWQRWQQLRTTLPDELVRSFLIGLARRNEWYQCLSSQSVEWQYKLDGLLRETASDEEGRFTFELFLDAAGHLRFARAIAADQKRGSEHQYREYNQDTRAAIEYSGWAAKTYSWNKQVRMLQSCQRLANQNQYRDYDSVSLLNKGQRYDRLRSSSRTHVISHAACWALSEFKDQEVCDCLTRIALAYARKKSDSPDYHFPSSFLASPDLYEMSNDSRHLSHNEMVAKYSEQEVRKLQMQSLYIEACFVQNDMTRIEEESRNETYYRTRSATWALEQIGDDRAVTCLNHILDSTPNKRFRHMLRPTLDGLAAKRGLSREDLAEQLISTYDLDALGKRTYQFGGYQVSLSITSGGRILRAIIDMNGKERKNLPVKVRKEHEQIWRTIQSEGKELAVALSLQKARMEAAMVDGRSWSSSRWQNLFATHPILGHLARRLIWNICAPDGKHLAYALPEQDGSWRTADNEILRIEEQSVLHLAHPIEMTPSEHTAWQRLIVTRRIVQPFKQAFREIYTLTPAEEETARYSNRFAAQLVQLHPFNGAARGRGWTGTIAHASEGVAIGWRDYEARNIRACFLHRYDSRDHDLIGVLGQVSFFPAGFHANPHGMQYEMALPLPEVEPVVFSEAMRDLDLFLSISSIGVDPAWQDQEPARERQERISREQGRMRAELLRELLPVLELTDRVRVEEHVALITGSYADYQVHLGSGNILLRPLGRYLCIVPKTPDEHLYLPFEENDGKTSEILSKILLLVQDEQITDPTILRQIRSKG